MTDTQAWFATCPKGLESLLVDELAGLGATDVSAAVAGVRFQGALGVGYRACLWSRLANRVLLTLAEAEVSDAAALHGFVIAQRWRDWLQPGGSLRVDFHGGNASIRNTRYGAQVVKDGIADYCRDAGLPRPRVERDPDVRVHLRLHRDVATLSLDFSGESLHRRGHRLEGGRAPLKENLAAAILLRADWPGLAARGGALIDPMCGSGTLLLEGAMMAADIAPGLTRERWGFECLAIHHPQQWSALRRDATARAERGRAAQLPEMRGYDADAAALRRAAANVRAAGLEGVVRFTRKPLAQLKRPTHRQLHTGLVVCNPPYGERIGEQGSLPYLYNRLGRALAEEFAGWQAAVLAPDKALGRAIGLRSHRQYLLYNGAIPVQLLLFDLDESNRWREWSDGSSVAGPVEPAPAQRVPDREVALSPGAEMFANRLRKNLRGMQRWAQRENVHCYRIYDADMPEYAVAVDRYEDALHVAEYRAPPGIDAGAAARRLEEVRQVLPLVTGVAPARIHFKTRQRQRGRDQYERAGGQGEFLAVREGAVRLLVNLSDYLDTGLFLDHRPLRLQVAREARGKSLLNLFCYTASISVHAAAGGARNTTSVDLSRTYLDWARRNLALNGFDESRHTLEQADCREWLAASTARYDLIVLDPPSFSNSKKMRGTLDIQRDHAELLRLAVARLAPGGVLYFSCNLRKFRLEPGIEDFCAVRDITPQTVDFDFKRRPKVHQCWRISEKKA